MTPEENREAINAAIGRFITDRNAKAMPTGWFLSYGWTTYDDDGDPVWHQSYAVSPSCDTSRAVGLAEIGRISINRDIVSGTVDASDDD